MISVSSSSGSVRGSLDGEESFASIFVVVTYDTSHCKTVEVIDACFSLSFASSFVQCLESTVIVAVEVDVSTRLMEAVWCRKTLCQLEFIHRAIVFKNI